MVDLASQDMIHIWILGRTQRDCVKFLLYCIIIKTKNIALPYYLVFLMVWRISLLSLENDTYNNFLFYPFTGTGGYLRRYENMESILK